MAVRFLPPPGADAMPVPERGDLAEVIDLRSRLARQEPQDDPVLDDAEETPAAQTPAAEGSGAQLRSLRAAIDRAESGELPDGAIDAESDEPQRSAEEDGVRLLARKARSSGELRRELQQLGHDAHEVDAVLLDFETSLYLDDIGLARVVTEALRERKRASRSQIRMKLRERLLPDGVIEQALGELDDDQEHELLRTAAEDRARRLTGLDRQTAERRLLGFLARRGWSGERATRVAREALDRTGGGSVRFR
ncbi:MAG: regulatory protein RecX [Actinobacteria bacterium]|nr:regulatory protein RecX [Actinomycetota bacterium]